MTAALFLVEWDPTTDTAHVRATFDTIGAEETVAGLDQFAACMRKLAEIDNLTGVSGREYVDTKCEACSHVHSAHQTAEGNCVRTGCHCVAFVDEAAPTERPFARTPTCSCGHTRSQHGRDSCNMCDCTVGHE